ncbi:MAG: calcium-binding protein [Rhizobiaceae bacterium]
MPFFDTGPTINGTSGNDFLIGRYVGPNHVMNGGDGNDVMYGDFEQFFQGFSSTITGAANYNLSATVNAFSWTRQENRDIANSTTVSHMSVIPTNLTGNQGWLSVTVVAGQTMTLDVDYGRDTNNSDTDTILRIVAGDGTTVLAQNDDGTAVDTGSAFTRDSNLSYTFANAGTYLINISEYINPSNQDGGVFEANDEFMLHISLTGQAFEADPNSGIDRLNGGNGDDVLYGFGGADILNGGLGADVLNGGISTNQFETDFASYVDATSGIYARLDGLSAASGEAIGDVFISIEGFIGSAFNDVLVGSNGFNRLRGGNGNDQLYGLGDGDSLNGGLGADVLNGGDGEDSVTYEDSTTGIYARLDGVAGASGEAIGDTFISIENFVGSDFADILVGSNGENQFFASQGNDTIYGLNGDDNIQAGFGDDVLYGGNGTDFLVGQQGNDNIYGGADADFLYGEDGFDNARYDFATSAVYARLDGVAGASGEAIGDTFDSIEGIIGSAFNDIFVGSSTGAEYLLGQGGNDVLYGLGGNDNLYGGAGFDRLFGGAGADRFVFNTAANTATNYDTIRDFQAGVDDIVLSQAIFAGIGATLDASEFQLGSANAATDRILYFSTTGQLFYDADGNGAAGAQLIATVTAGTALTINDFVMI